MEQYKFLFGSKMLGLSNNRDEDWLTFVDERANVAREMGCKSIPFYRTVLNTFITGNNIKVDIYNASYLYQQSAPFFTDEKYPFKDFNIFEHKAVWVRWLKAYVNSKAIEKRATATDTLPKIYYHLLYQYYMLTEDVHFISDEAKAQVQKIHDLEMPSTYFYELRELINNL